MRVHSGVVCGFVLALAAACGDDEAEKRGDLDGDGWVRPLDCDDRDARVFPGADEVPYDGVDQDCSGADVTDVDADGFEGAARASGNAGAAGAAGASAGDGAEDCDDTRPDVHPASVDICDDGVDQDCSGSDQACDALDADADGTTAFDGDCNDRDAAVNPEQDETYYNGVDDDCDPTTNDSDQDGDGFSKAGGGDCADENPEIFPGADEVAYDGVDQDCSGGDWVDRDGDGVAGVLDPSLGTADCDDADATVSPAREEVPLDGVDQNCDGSDLVGTTEFSAMNSTSAVPADVPRVAGGFNEAGGIVGLVAWADSRTAPSQDVYVHAVRSDGTPLGSEILVATGGLAKANVQVVADGNDFETEHASVFLVTWETPDGIFGRLMSAEGPNADETQIAPAGAVEHDVAYGGGNFAIAWRQSDAAPVELRVRLLSTAGLKGDNLLIDQDNRARDVALAGRDNEFVVVWYAAGIWGQVLEASGVHRGNAFEVSDASNTGSPAIAASEAGYYVAYQRRTIPHLVQGIAIDDAGQPLGATARLSDDALTITDLELIATDTGYLAAWTDARHTVTPPGYGAIYASRAGFDGTPVFVDRALHVELNVRLGGL
ncbi:MAG TPA: putative metal-binding motif-containing protein, partial [Polyangiaceae bacterium]